MSQRITKLQAKTYVGYYHAACELKGENKNQVTRYYELERKVIEDLFARADEEKIPCKGLRIYLAKQQPYDENAGLPKFSSLDNYNLVVVGVDDNNSNIHLTDETHDYLSSVAGPPSASDF